MPRQSRLPDTHSDLLKQIAGWRRIDRGFNAISGMFASSAKAKNIMSEQAMLLRQGKQRDIFSGFSESLRSARGKVEGGAGQRIDRAIEQFNRQIQAKGGANISQKDLSGLIGTLHSKVKAAAPLAMGMQKEYVGHLLGSIRQAKKGVMERGVLGLAQGHDLLDSSVKRLEAVKNLPQSQQLLGKVMRNARGKVTDAAIARRLGYDRGRFHREFNQARNLEEKRDAAKRALERNEALRRSARGDDAKALKEVSDMFRGFLKSSSGGRGLIGVGQKLAAGLRRSVQVIGAATQVIKPLKNAIGGAVRAYSFVNEGVNRFARSQMMITSERAAYGRAMRGAGMNFSSMMSAINTGRRAGMEDSAVVDKMATMQEQLARARWGEGKIIDNLGKWGLTPFDESGDMKDFHRVMIDISNKFNSLGSDMEKLQFLSMQGFSPDQMEYVKNYAKDAQEWEYKKRNPHLMGVLDQARILDESGEYARIDAATKMELKRRQILNQNAIDEGILPGIKRMVHPENWFFQDWTARKRGVDVAKSEKATEELTKELVRLRNLMKDNEGGIGERGGGGGAVPVITNPDVLQGLGLAGGWAAADIANFGDKSGVHILRQLYAQQMGLKNQDDVEASKKTAASVASIGGILLGIAGAVGTIAAIVGSGGIAAIPMAIGAGSLAGGVIAGGGLALGAAIGNSYWDDGSQKHVEALRRRKGNPEAINAYLQEHNLQGLTPEMINSKDFEDDEKAAKMLSGAYMLGRIFNAQKLTDKTIDVEKAKNFAADKYLMANKKAAIEEGRALTEAEVDSAMARMGTGDSSIGIDEKTAYNYIKYGYDENSMENIQKRNQEIGRLRKQRQKEGKVEGRDYTYQELETEAKRNVKQEWVKSIPREVYEKARNLGSTESSGHLQEEAEAQYEAQWEYIKHDNRMRNHEASRLLRLSKEELLEEERKQREEGKRFESEGGSGEYAFGVADTAKEIYERIRKYGNTKEEVVANMKKEKEESSSTIDNIIGEKPVSFYTDEEKRDLLGKELEHKPELKSSNWNEAREKAEADFGATQTQKESWKKAAEQEWDSIMEEVGVPSDVSLDDTKKFDKALKNMEKEATNLEEQGKFKEAGEVRSKMKALRKVQELRQFGTTKEEVVAAKVREKEKTAENYDETFATLPPEEQKRILGERTKVYAEAKRQELLNAAEEERKMEEGMSFGARLKRASRRAGISIDEARGVLFKDEEVDEIEKKIEAGDTIDQDTQDKFEQYKKSSKYKARQAKKETEVKKKEEQEKKQVEEQSVEDEFNRRFGAGSSGEGIGEGVSPEGTRVPKPRAEAEMPQSLRDFIESVGGEAAYKAMPGVEASQRYAEFLTDQFNLHGKYSNELPLGRVGKYAKANARSLAEEKYRELYGKKGGRISGEKAGVEGGEEIPKPPMGEEGTAPKAEGTSSEQQAEGSKPLSDTDIKIMRKARARGLELSKGGYSSEQIEQFEKGEEDRKKLYLDKRFGDEEDYEEFTAIEQQVLSGKAVSEEDRKKYEETAAKIDRAKPKTERTTLHKKRELTPEEKAIHERISAKAEAWREKRKYAETPQLHEATLSAMYRIDKFKAKGGTDEETIKQFGEDRVSQYQQYKDREEYKEYKEKQDKEEAEKKGEEQKQEAGERALPVLHRYRGNLSRDRKGGHRARRGRVQTPYSSVRRLEAKIQGNRLKGVTEDDRRLKGVSDIDELVGSPSLQEYMRQKAQRGETLVAKMNNHATAAESAASSSKYAQASGAEAARSQVINFGGQNIVQNIQGTYPLDKEGMKEGTIQGATEVRDKTCEALVQVNPSLGKF